MCTAVNETNAHYNKSLHRTLRSLRKNNAIKICKFDKGNGTIVLNSSEYFEKLDEIINTDKFIEIPISHNENHPIIKTENSIQYFLRKYIRPFVSDDAYKLIYPVGSRPGALYGLAKVHKDNIPLRPVISMIGTPQYNLAKYLDTIIKPCIPATFMLNSTDDFVSRLNGVTLPDNYSFVSFDVESLFTNVPLQEVIDLACHYV